MTGNILVREQLGVSGCNRPEMLLNLRSDCARDPLWKRPRGARETRGEISRRRWFRKGPDLPIGLRTRAKGMGFGFLLETPARRERHYKRQDTMGQNCAKAFAPSLIVAGQIQARTTVICITFERIERRIFRRTNPRKAGRFWSCQRCRTCAIAQLWLLKIA